MEFDNPDRLNDLPVFPLATVLFPGAVMPLHIFEDRYKQMIQYAIENGGTFGLSYHDAAAIGRETPPEIGSIGCLAKIDAVMPMSEGRLNLVSTGLVRYRIVGFNQIVPFLIARVEPFTDDLEPETEPSPLYDEVTEIGRKFLDLAQMLDESNYLSSQDLPEDPEAMSLVMASLLPIDAGSKQRLLEMTSTRLRLTRLKAFLTDALAEFAHRLETQERAKNNGHGRLS